MVIVTFLLTRALPGDPAAYFAGPAATKEAIEQIRSQARPRPAAARAVRGLRARPRPRRSRQFAHDRPAGGDRDRARLPASAELTLLGLDRRRCWSRCRSASWRRRGPGSLVDHACRIVATAGVSLPVFFTGLVLVYVFYYLLGWAPAPLGPPRRVLQRAAARHRLLSDRQHRSRATGRVFTASLKQLMLPALTLASSRWRRSPA